MLVIYIHKGLWTQYSLLSDRQIPYGVLYKTGESVSDWHNFYSNKHACLTLLIFFSLVFVFFQINRHI